MELAELRPGIDPGRLKRLLDWFAARAGYGSAMLVGRAVWGYPPPDDSRTASRVIGVVDDEMDEWLRGER